jgi:hypothetical protein
MKGTEAIALAKLAAQDIRTETNGQSGPSVMRLQALRLAKILRSGEIDSDTLRLAETIEQDALDWSTFTHGIANDVRKLFAEDQS